MFNQIVVWYLTYAGKATVLLKQYLHMLIPQHVMLETIINIAIKQKIQPKTNLNKLYPKH